MRVILHIEELTLHGFPAAARHAIGDAVRRELADLLGSEALPERLRGDGVIDRLSAPPMRPPGAADGTGRAIAAAVYGALGTRTVRDMGR